MSQKIIDISPPTFTKVFKEKTVSFAHKKGKFWGKKKKVIALVFLIIICIALLLQLVFSRAIIEIWPETQTLTFDETITADLAKNDTKDLVSSKVIPAQILEDPERIASQKFPSSGKVLKEVKAQGKIKVINDYHLSQTLAVNTRFQVSPEKVLWFRSTKEVVVPAKGSLEIDVIADRSGEEYNIEPSTFSIPGLVGSPRYTTIYGKSSSKMEGGFKGDVPKVEKEDLERAKNVLVKELFDKASELLKNKAADDFILLDGVTKEEVLETSSSAEAGAEAQFFTFQAKVKSQALVFKKSDLESFAKEFILSKTQEGKKIQENSLKINYSSESIDPGAGKIVLKLNFSAKIYSSFETPPLKEVLKGKSLREAQAILENKEQVKKVEITAWPPWIKTVPDNTEKIKINLTID